MQAALHTLHLDQAFTYTGDSGYTQFRISAECHEGVGNLSMAEF